MKWIKLFESFDNLENKIKFANNIYFYKRFFLDLIETDIEKIETKKYIKVNLSSTHVSDWMKYERYFARSKES